MVVLDEWPSYSGGRISRFDCISSHDRLQNFIISTLLNIG